MRALHGSRCRYCSYHGVAVLGLGDDEIRRIALPKRRPATAEWRLPQTLCL